MNIPNLGLSIQDGCILMVSISFVFTLVTFLIKKNKEMQKRENALSSSEYFELYLNRFMHWVSNSIILLFPYIFKPSVLLYIIYDVYLLVVVYLWYLVIQCPISIHEKRILFNEKNKYTVDSSKRLQVYVSLLMSEKIFNYTFFTLYIMNASLVTFWLVQYYYSLQK